ncbi:MAG TPA: amino acid adenylation domain-containing protein [Gemmataceae bacterium]|nr:amino acid adenylation domain-containing protein [Gemmataceae bacterium]
MAMTSRGSLSSPTPRLATESPCATTDPIATLHAWNRTRTDYPKDGCIPQLFEAQVERTPDAVAAVCQDHELSYRELNRRANQLAHYLRELGVGPEVPVGICVARSLQLAVAVLGVLKAGGAYVPLDAAYPDDRLAFMLADTSGPVLLTQKPLLARLPASTARVVCLDTDEAVIGRKAMTNPVRSGTAESLAYVIYTSGSTGKPKGIAMEHRPLVNLLCWQMRHSRLPPEARTLQFAPLSFDVSFQEMFSTWCAGGTLLMIPEGLRRDPAGLVRFLAHRAVQRVFMPFVALQQIADAAHGEGPVLQALREVITAGEQLKITPTIIRFFEEHPDCTLQNQYGPSESHVVTAYTLTGRPSDWATLPPIGAPIANTEIYLLNARRELVLPGETGELYIGGDCLARGYWNRPELTSERFLVNPFRSQTPSPAGEGEGSKRGERLYRTGDLARYLPDGNLEFLGRLDHQVKIRGFRIELGEIEAVLCQHPAIHAAAVLRREDTPGQVRLVAYLVTEKKHAPSMSAVRRFVRERLPEYMVPSALVVLESLPLTPSGKVDLQALPPPGQERPLLDQPFVEARTELERQLKQIWGEILRIRPIGVRDPFSELGGDSLQAAHLFLQVQKTIGKILPLWPPLQEMTIEHLADLLTRPTLEASGSALVEIRSGGVRPPFFLVHGIGGELISYSHLVRFLGPEQPVYGFQQLPSELGAVDEPRSVEVMAASYIEEMLAMHFQEPFLLGGYSFGGVVAFEMAQQLMAKGYEVGLLAILDESFPDMDEKGSWSARWLGGFAQNLPFWLWDEFLPRTPRQHYARILRIARRFKQRIATLFGHSPANALEEDVSELFVVSRLSEGFRVLCEANYRALKNYRAQVYPGKITLFRGRTQPLLARHRPDLGWGGIAAGGLAIQIIPGTHGSILKEPHVKVLADRLRAVLGGN